MIPELLCLYDNDPDIQAYIVEAYVLEREIRLLRNILTTLDTLLPERAKVALESLKDTLEIERERLAKHVDLEKIVLEDYIRPRKEELKATQ